MKAQVTLCHCESRAKRGTKPALPAGRQSRLKSLSLIALALVMAFIPALSLKAEEIILTTIMPSQDVLKVKKGVVGTTYKGIASGSITDNDLYIEGLVGIGTTGPTQKLDLCGGATVTGGNIILGDYTGTVSRYIGTYNSPAQGFTVNSGFSGIEFGPPGGTGEGYLAFHAHDYGSTSGEKMRIDKVGNVGIGTTSPGGKLEIISPNNTYPADEVPSLSIRQVGNNAYGWDWIHDDNVNGDLHLHRVENDVSTQVMSFDRSTGNVGIGTTDPEAELHVYSNPYNVKIGAGGIGIRRDQLGISDNTALGSIDFRGTETGGGAVNERGALIYVLADQHWSANDSPARLEFRTTPDGSDVALTRMVIRSTGNVGIGTTAPGATLEVEGTVTMFGAWESKSPNTIYLAPSDGFVTLIVASYEAFDGYTDGNNPPTTRRITGNPGVGFCMPVRKGDYWKMQRTTISLLFLLS